jgi:pimeloyl-ACP methyl ester carboxylesterase
MRTVTSRDGTRIAFDVQGQGPPVILVNGALADRSAGAPLAALLAERLTVYMYDRRGRGDSGDTPPYAVEREIEDLRVMIAAAGGSAYVYGSSSGAALALEAAASGLAIQRLAVWEPPYIRAGSRPPPPEGVGERLRALVSLGRRGDAVEHFLQYVVGMPKEVVAQARQAPYWPAQEAMAHTLAYDVAILGNYGLPAARLAAVEVPTLVLCGGASAEWIQQTAQAVAEALPAGRYRAIADQTHGAAPQAVAPVLLEFFSQERTAGAGR